MNSLIKAISELCNLQRDKYLKNEAEQKKKKSKKTGFADVLKEEQERGKK